jgi:hypothetical protein
VNCRNDSNDVSPLLLSPARFPFAYVTDARFTVACISHSFGSHTCYTFAGVALRHLPEWRFQPFRGRTAQPFFHRNRPSHAEGR